MATGSTRSWLAAQRANNMRWEAYRFTGGDFQPMGSEQGGGWGDDRGVRSLAIGDVDGADGQAEIAVGRTDGDGCAGRSL